MFGVTLTQIMKVTFTSDYSVEYGGFSLIYMEVDRLNLRKFNLITVGRRVQVYIPGFLCTVSDQLLHRC